MRKEQLLQEIASLDEQITRLTAAAALPQYDSRQFPLGKWVLTALIFGWAEFGYRIPDAYIFHVKTARYAWYLTIFMVAVTLVSTFLWMMRGFNRHKNCDEYYTASRQARELQLRRKELQAELLVISGE